MKSKKISEIASSYSFNICGMHRRVAHIIISACIYSCGSNNTSNLGGGTRGAGGAMASPDFKIYVFGPPQISNQKLTNIEWKSLLSMHVLQFLKCNLHEIFLLEVYAYIAAWKLSTIQGCPIYFRPPPGSDMFLRL